MPLAPGTRLGPYEVIGLIGAGGMGEVWLATELSLRRNVALKILPPDVTRDSAQVLRFDQEARSASALNHPNVCTIHALGTTDDGQHYIAMEYIEGETLRQRLSTTRLSAEDALEIAIQVAAALSAAHTAGIIHRDIKPENVMRRPDGFVKVLDFGLAKLAPITPEILGSNTTRAVLKTEAGVVVGTVAYMSPEQARGQGVDARTDVWSLGVLLYEMVAGRSPFAGPTGTDVLAAILQNDPQSLAHFDPNASPELQRIITKSLRKDRSQRYQTVRDLLLDLQALRESFQSHARWPSGPAPSDRTEQGDSGVIMPVTSVPGSKRRLLLAAVAAVILGAGAGAWWWLRNPAPAGTVDNAAVGRNVPDRPTGPSPRVSPLTTLRGQESWPTFSPDASHVAFVWGGEQGENFDIYVTTIGASEIRRVTTHADVDSAPSWSPDGRQIAYIRAVARFPGAFEPYDKAGAVSGTVHVTSPLGGSDMKVSDVAVSPPLTWAPDGRYVAARYLPAAGDVEAGIDLIAVASGEHRPLTRVKPPAIHLMPAFSPSGRQLAYTSCAADRCEIQVLELDEGMVPRHPPRRLTQAWVDTYAMSSLAWTPDGRSIVYTGNEPSAAAFTSYLWKIGVDGAQRPERLEFAGSGATMPTAALSRNYLAFASSVVDQDIFRFQPGRPAQLVAGSTLPETDPRFSPDGRRLAFSSARSGSGAEIWIADSDGANVRQLTRGPGSIQGSPSWSPDGRQIAFDSAGHTGTLNIWTVEADGGRPQQITNAPGNQVVPSWSRDGRWIYFAATESNSFAIWRLPVGGGAPRRMTGGGTGRFTSETADGTRLVYQAADADSAVMMMPVTGGAARQLVACVKNAAFGVGAQGVYYVPCGSSADPPLRLLNPDTGHDRLLGRLERFEQSLGVPSLGLSIAPDGSVLYPRTVTDSADLMLIENFR